MWNLLNGIIVITMIIIITGNYIRGSVWLLYKQALRISTGEETLIFHFEKPWCLGKTNT